MTASPADRPVLVGRYRISDHLASSPIDDVYKGFDPLIERPVVVRVFRLRPSDLAAESAIKRTFYSEMQTAGALMHHGIATLYDAGETPEGLFTAVEFLEARTLSSLLASGLDRDVLLRVSLLSQVADALEYARDQGLPHLYLRPSSVLVAADYTLKVGGFGIARLVDALTAASGRAAVASSRYAAPERVRGEPGDHRSDVYSLALIALDLLGEPSLPPSFGFSPTSDTIPPVCAELAALGVNRKRWTAVFDRALSPEPADRFENPGELEIELLLTLGIAVAEARTARESAHTSIFLTAAATPKSPRRVRAEETATFLSLEPEDPDTTQTDAPAADSDRSYAETMLAWPVLADAPEKPSKA
jgi:serine/threonine protein kinase